MAVVSNFRLAVESHAHIIAGASDIRCIVKMGALPFGGLAITSLMSTLCSSAVAGIRMALIAFAKLLMRRQRLGIHAASTVSFCNSLVSALRCALGLKFGTWQCCGKSPPDPEMRYGRASETK